MKSRFDLGLKKTTVNKILAVLIAITLWLYVFFEINPLMSTTITDVPVQLINTELLTEKGLAVAGDGKYSVSIVVTGKRAELSRMEQDQIEAHVNLFGYDKGEYRIEVKTNDLSGGLSITEVKPKEIAVVIEELDSRSKEVEIVVSGSIPSNTEVTYTEIKPQEIEVTGAKSEVAMVSRLETTLPAEMITEAGEPYIGEVLPLSAEGDIVGNVQLSSETVEIVAQLLTVKEVSLRTEVTGEQAAGYSVNVDAPKTINVKGTKAALSEVTSIQAAPIDITGITGNQTIPLELALPDGISLAGGVETINASVTVRSVYESNFTYDTSEIEIQGLNDGLSASIEEGQVELTVKGGQEAVTSLRKDDVQLVVKVGEAEPGAYSMKVEGVTSKDVELVFNPDSVNITLVQSEDEEEE